MNIEKSKDLIEFIKCEKVDKLTIPHKSILTYFSKCCFKTITELAEKFKDHDDKENCILMGSKMFFYVFFIVLVYSNNLKLTMFLSERAILLYSEFIIMSSDKNISNDLNYIPNISDAISFAYKKTIGPIKITDLTHLEKINSVKDVSNIIINLYNILFMYNFTIFKNINIIDDLIVSGLYNIFNKINQENREYIHQIIINNLNNNIESNIVIIKIIIDNFNKIININNNIDIKITKILFETIYIPLFDNYTLKLDDIYNTKTLNLTHKLRMDIRRFKKLNGIYFI
jgi:hypothetical protein